MSKRESTTMTMAKIIKPQNRMKNIIIIILRMLVIHKVSAATLLIIYIKFNIIYILHHFLRSTISLRRAEFMCYK